MINNTVLHTKMFYYPLGNTPPVSLTQDLPPEQDADILLLGCGDVRNILFTCFVDNTPRRMDITCCDIEPGIHARNILLYSLLIDDKGNLNVHRIWNIYYHWMLDEDSLELLETQTEKLLQLSSSMEQWHVSTYGSVIRFCEELSLSRVRSYWSCFSSRGLSPARNKNRLRQLKDAVAEAKTIRAEEIGKGLVLTGSRSALPAVYNEIVKDLPEIANHWWDHGTLPLCSEPASKISHINASFFYSPNSALTLHYDTSPLLGFPLSTANTQIKKTCSLCIDQRIDSSVDRLVKSAKSHFLNWAIAFRRAVKKNLTIRIFSGDALHLCFSLSSNCGNDSGFRPSKFDCVDTSNLADHLGPLNVIALASILLKHYPSSSLYTEMLVQTKSNVRDRLTESMRADVRTVSFLLGLVCPDLFTNATNCMEEDSITSKIFRVAGKTPPQARSRLRWKRLTGNIKSNESAYVCAEAEALAKFFIHIYDEMFKHEHLEKALKRTLNYANDESAINQFISSSVNPRYNRASFVFLLNIVKSNVSSDWDKCVKIICDEVCIDDLSGLPSASEDLFLHMHFFGVHCEWSLKFEPADLCGAIISPALPKNEELQDQLYVTIRVPRKILDVITSKKCTPAIVCSISGRDPRGISWECNFSSVHISFGEWRNGSDKSGSGPCIVEDSCQISGRSDMFASFLVPTKVLLRSKQSIPLVRCKLLATYFTIKDFSNELGFDLCLSRKEITSNDVFITQFLPGMSALPKYIAQNLQHEAGSTSITLRFTDDCSKLKTLVSRIDLHCEAAKAKLAMKSSSVKIEFHSPLLAFVTIANSLKLEFRFPVPVSVSSDDYKVRFGRTSSFIEIETSFLDPLQKDAASFMFPTFLTNIDRNVTIPMAWTASYIDLDAMPEIDFRNATDLSWLNLHFTQMFSERELSFRQSEISDTRTELKDSLGCIFAQFTGLQGQARQDIFGLRSKSFGVHALILPSCLRLDLANYCVVLDCALIPHKKTMIKDMPAARFIQKVRQTGFNQIAINDKESRAWKVLMPALTERCRTNATWTHKSTCEYFKTGEVPLAEGLNQDSVPSICTCGIGKFPNGYLDKLKEKFPELNYVLKRYATRAAIAPIFPVEYVEEHFFPDATAFASAVRTCGSCGSDRRKTHEENLSNLLTCSRCKVTKYCSPACQKTDWKRHKTFCKQRDMS